MSSAGGAGVAMSVSRIASRGGSFPAWIRRCAISKAMEPPPDMVYLRLNFVNAVPVEYYWATSDAKRRQNGGHGIQRMTVEAWLEAVERPLAT